MRELGERFKVNGDTEFDLAIRIRMRCNVECLFKSVEAALPAHTTFEEQRECFGKMRIYTLSISVPNCGDILMQQSEGEHRNEISVLQRTKQEIEAFSKYADEPTEQRSTRFLPMRE